MAKRINYRPPESYRSKDPEARARQLANLKPGSRKATVKPLSSSTIDAVRCPWKYKRDVIGHIEDHFYIPETKKPIVLLDWQRKVLQDIFEVKQRPSLVVVGSTKKSGKSALVAAVLQWFLTNVDFCEGYILAPDLDAGADVIFSSLKKSIRMNPQLRKSCMITKSPPQASFRDGVIKVLPNDLSISGLRPTVTAIDEPWQFRTENDSRVLDEMTTNPVGKHLTLAVSYAGFVEDQSDDLHLWRWYQRGRAIQEGKEDADPSFYFFWKEDYSGVPWVEGTNYLKNQRKLLRPASYERFHENKWVSAFSSFVNADILDACFHIDYKRGTPPEGAIAVGVDCGPKWDATALVAVSANGTGGLKVVDHGIFEGRGETLDLQKCIEDLLLLWHKQYQIQSVFYDPYQMIRSAQELKKKGLPMREYPQTVPNMVRATQTLSELISSGNLMFYPDSIFRQHILAASVKEHTQGLRLVKTKQSLKIDLCIAAAMAVQSASENFLLKPPAGLEIISFDDDIKGDPDGMFELVSECGWEL